MQKFDGASFVGHVVEGIPTGFCWKGLAGGSWIFGRVDDEGRFSGLKDWAGNSKSNR
jgi:hypothetical protein